MNIVNFLTQTGKTIPNWNQWSVWFKIMAGIHIILGWIGACLILGDVLPWTKAGVIFWNIEPILLFWALGFFLIKENIPFVKGLMFWLGGIWGAGTWALWNNWSLDFTAIIVGNIALIKWIVYLYLDWHYRKIPPAILAAKLRALEARMRPHFFFNTINGIIMLLHKKPNEAENALLDLADVFRALMKENKGNGVNSLEYEIEITKKYISIEKIRFGEKLDVIWAIDPNINLKEELLPSLLLQPLIENAIVHGIEPMDEGEIEIKISKNETNIEIIVENDCLEEGKKNRTHNGLALDNLKQRIELLYDGNAILEGSKMIDDGYAVWRVYIRIPSKIA